MIVSPDLLLDWGDVNALTIHTDKFGVDLIEGQEYFIEMYRMDIDTGFIAESICVRTICVQLYHVRHEEHVSVLSRLSRSLSNLLKTTLMSKLNSLSVQALWSSN